MNTTTLDVQTLIKQLGTALPMMGAKNLVYSTQTLQFSIGRNPKSVKTITIQLDPDDTYTVRALTKGYNVDARIGVYADALHATLESLTGLYTRL